jgi:hypothetical protein
LVNSPTRSTGILADYDTAFAGSFAGYLNREKDGECSMLNFGGGEGNARSTGATAVRHSTPSCSGPPATGATSAAEEMEWHNRDVDTVHHHQDGSAWAAFTFIVWATPATTTPSPVKPPKGIPGGRMSSHTFIEGHLNYYFLTGDLRSLKPPGAPQTPRLYETRNYASPIAAIQAGTSFSPWRCTTPPTSTFYLTPRIIVERVLERQTADSGWRLRCSGPATVCRAHGNAGSWLEFSDRARHYYEATRDGWPRAPSSVARISDRRRVAAGDRRLRYTSCPKSFTGAWSNFLLFDGIVFAHQRTKDAKLRQVLYRGTPSALKTMVGWGKGFTQYTREAPHFLGYLAELREGESASR